MARILDHKQHGEEVAGESTSAVIAALFANLAIAITKFIAAFFSGSASMMAEGFHSLVDTGNQGFLLLGIKRSKQAADDMHPFGYGNELYFWAFVVAILLFALGSGFSVYEGVTHILGNEMEEVSDATFPWIPIGVLVAAFAFEGYSWSVAARGFNAQRAGGGIFKDIRDLKDPAIFVVLAEDTAACIGIVIAAGGVLLSWWTGNATFDGIASILIGVILGVVAALLAVEVKGLLIGEAASPAITDDIRRRLLSHPEISGINELRSLHFGPKDVLVTMSLDFRDDVLAGEIENIVADLEGDIRSAHPIVRKLYFEVQSAADHDRFEASAAIPA